MQERSLLHRVLRAAERAVTGLIRGLLFLLMVSFLVSAPFVLIRASSENLPRAVHFLVIGVAALLLGGGIYIISTRDLRKKWFPWIFEMFGPFGPLVYCALILVSADAVLASVTYTVFDAGLVDMSTNLPGGVTEARLLDFYMWHFFELIPLVSINETANLAEPATYSGTWVGILVLVFQGLVVVPILATIRFYFTEEGREARRKEREKRVVMKRLDALLKLGGEGETLNDLDPTSEDSSSIDAAKRSAERATNTDRRADSP